MLPRSTFGRCSTLNIICLYARQSFRSLLLLLCLCFLQNLDFYALRTRQTPRIKSNFACDMCFRVVEKFPVCGCIYHIHSIDRCAYYGRHAVIDKIVWVGSSCPRHGG
ncbi:hypothetical protein T440DRAFT_273692 [Plenodomus tracheiphilus IPT5]|uniref:Uncharacterized protein n=1 Tax=Plenodomus tracheiphilus IPT5 TaxID=1408161 RepID=A0A6A7BFR7_9PLEO|nr:hypothetical protein T440DRAFT_273692 [Plenodomus tracheiphilus IPT5]